MPLLSLRRFQQSGHGVIAVAGGATGMIGDPSGRSEERNAPDRTSRPDRNRRRHRGVSSPACSDFDDGATPAELVDNADLVSEPVSYIEFLRDVGKHVTVNHMVAKESVNARVESEHGISLTELSYMLLQANDYWC